MGGRISGSAPTPLGHDSEQKTRQTRDLIAGLTAVAQDAIARLEELKRAKYPQAVDQHGALSDSEAPELVRSRGTNFFRGIGNVG